MRRIGLAGMCGLLVAMALVADASAQAPAGGPAQQEQEKAEWEAFRARFAQYRRTGPQLRGPAEGPEAELSAKVTKLSQLMRQEYGGTTRRNAISPQQFEQLQRGLDSTDLKPLTDMGAAGRYKDQDGGLYGDGRNVPPDEHLAAARKAMADIQPLDAQGSPAADGKIVLLCIGMSNTHMAFGRLQQIARGDRDLSQHLVLVDGASGGQHAPSWADPAGNHARAPRLPGGGTGDNWSYVAQQLKQAGVTPEQVQVVWMKQAIMNAGAYGAFPAHAQALQDALALTMRNARRRFPNLRLAFVSSRTYAGYAVRELNPEPYAYESAFAVRWMIQDQIAGKPELNHDPQRGPVQAPVLLWGPYLWADGMTGRQTDGLTYERADYSELPDGTHPSDRGADKIARQILTFFKTDPLARPWFTRPTSATR